MSEVHLQVTTAISRAAYGGMDEALQFLAGLSYQQLLHTSLGLSVISHSLLESLAATTGEDVEEVRDKWLAELTDTATTTPSPGRASG